MGAKKDLKLVGNDKGWLLGASVVGGFISLNLAFFYLEVKNLTFSNIPDTQNS